MNKHLQFRINRTFFGKSYESLITPLVDSRRLIPLLYGAQAQLEQEARDAGGRVAVRSLTESHVIVVSHSDKEWVNRMEGRVRDTIQNLINWIEHE
ncbi:MAG: hypothetical protein L0177_01205 [Chloroflexi bacterium]|nr:hypothetical protein [Chloroflexota bacterium]